MTGQQGDTGKPSRGPGSFCISRAALDALIDAKATVYEICAYLVLARFTEATGRYSTASMSAINRYTGANKLKGGPVTRAIERLKTVRATRTTKVSNGRSGKSHALVDERQDLGPILISRDTWQAQAGDSLPDGPIERGKIMFVLPDFDEPLPERVWFGGNLVTGINRFDRPLKALKNAGDVAARLLLLLYAANDMETWGGVRPVGENSGPWKHYEPVDPHAIQLHGGARLIRAKEGGEVASIPAAVSGGNNQAYWDALRALKSAGLIYEVVLVLNRNAQKAKLASTGEEYGAIPNDAEPLYELGCRTKHGYKPVGEAGISGATARTAGELGRPVTERGFDDEGNAMADGHFDGTYAAIVPDGYPAMIAGIYRLRFRVSNPRNAGVKNAWARIHHANHEMFEFVQRIRSANKLPPLAVPKEVEKAQVSRVASGSNGSAHEAGCFAEVSTPV